ncbi:HK97-gp10 family putative phage morphogenesis protein [Sansalvadorimonas verongulae]|uniref:HK97-gp10 family putative phage morphogenesis protein n=1 Tax=Sansalvadorimonas verongulae TaxID=2172824 RepID=UPI0012BB7A25|nr:HK97-gp10 family putative phage morphogenesis protein [Sansalvadorimonas verongulae]MTI13123.1 hypothetical protein [Sansalvadorimonas verongulae]
MSDSVKIEGLAELEKKLQELGAETGAKVLRGSMMTATKPLMDEIKILAPVRSFADDMDPPENYSEGGKGTIKGSIGRQGGIYKGDKTAKKFQETFASNKDTAAVVRVGAVKKGAWKAHFQEHGTDKHPPQPFIRPPFYRQWRDIVARMKKSLAKRIERVASK